MLSIPSLLSLLTNVMLGSPNVLLGAGAPQLNLRPGVLETATTEAEGREPQGISPAPQRPPASCKTLWDHLNFETSSTFIDVQFSITPVKAGKSFWCS